MAPAGRRTAGAARAGSSTMRPYLRPARVHDATADIARRSPALFVEAEAMVAQRAGCRGPYRRRSPAPLLRVRRTRRPRRACGHAPRAYAGPGGTAHLSRRPTGAGRVGAEYCHGRVLGVVPHGPVVRVRARYGTVRHLGAGASAGSRPTSRLPSSARVTPSGQLRYASPAMRGLAVLPLRCGRARR